MNQLIMGLIIIIPTISYLYITNILKSNYNEEYDKETTGFDISRKILNKNKLKDFVIIEKKGLFNDSYDIKRETLKLSTRNYHDNSITSIGMSLFIAYQIIYDKNKSISNYKNNIDNILTYIINIIYTCLLLGLLINNTRIINTMLWFLLFILIYFIFTSIYKYNVYKQIKEKENKNYEKLSEVLKVMIIFDYSKLITIIIDDIKYIIELIKNAEIK